MKIMLENWGPVKKFEYDFSKSLIITYGDNNIGKSYVMQVVYLLLKHLIEYSKKAIRFTYYGMSFFYEEDEGRKLTPEAEMVVEFSKNQNAEVIDISKNLEEFCSGILAQNIYPLLIDSFKNTFGTYADIMTGHPRIMLEVEERMHCVFELEDEQIQLHLNRKPTRLRKAVSEFHKSRNGKTQLDIYVCGTHVNTPIKLVKEEIIKMQKEFAVEILKRFSSVYFLPASRSGIYTGMGSFGSIMAQISQNRAYIKGPIQIPNIPEPISDYYMMLSEIRNDRSGKFLECAQEIEKSVLKGEVLYNKDSKSIVYMPFHSKLQMEMQDTSSMVSEISPITAFLKYIVSSEIPFFAKRMIGDAQPRAIVFIEEPEAHLHPDNQVKLIKSFVGLTGQNAVLVMASHSNYIFNQLNNLILDKSLDRNVYSPILLSQKNGKSISSYMKMDELGVDDENFADISAALLEEREKIIEKMMDGQWENE